MLGINETDLFAEVRIWNRHLKYLVGERLGIVILLNDSEYKVGFPSGDPNLRQELWVDEWIKLDEVVLGLILWDDILLCEADELLDAGLVTFDLKDQQE